jgi:hypothetical protein
MPSKSVPTLDIVITNFDQVARFDDREAFAHCMNSLRLSGKRLLPKSLRFNGCRVTRTEHRVTVHLHLDQREMARVGFISTPDFSRIVY